jgi:SAM-dependent methyltransferase
MDWSELALPWLSVEAELEAAMAPALELLMGAAALRRGQSVLDIGCGMGASLLAAARAVGPRGQVTAIDIAPPMVARARARAPANARVLEGDAESHPLGAARFDAAVSLFGTMFFADATAAFANIRAAMRPGAGFALVAWGARAANPWFGVGLAAVEAVCGAQPAPDPRAPGPFRYADPAAALGPLRSSGWEAEAATRTVMLRPAGSVEEVARLLMTVGSAPSALRAIGAGEAERAEVRAELVERLRPFEGPRGLRVPAELHVITAAAPGRAAG